MPLDFTGHPNAEAIRIVEKMEQILATPDKWCKNTLCDAKGARCLIGALYAENIPEDWQAKQSALVAMSQEALERGYFSECKVVDFNNDPKTTHADIIDFLAAVKARLYEKVEA